MWWCALRNWKAEFVSLLQVLKVFLTDFRLSHHHCPAPDTNTRHQNQTPTLTNTRHQHQIPMLLYKCCQVVCYFAAHDQYDHIQLRSVQPESWISPNKTAAIPGVSPAFETRTDHYSLGSECMLPIHTLLPCLTKQVVTQHLVKLDEDTLLHSRAYEANRPPQQPDYQRSQSDSSYYVNWGV